MKIFNDIGNEISDISIYHDVEHDNVICISFVGDFSSYIVKDYLYDLYYFNVSNPLNEIKINWYKVLNPTGTQLYKYTITGGNIASQGSTPLVVITYEHLYIPSEGTEIGQLLADKFILTGSYPYQGGSAVLNRIGTSSSGFYCYGGGNQEFTGTDFTYTVTEL